ncbi:MAG: hypothetical protein U1F67_15375 [Rubrivivax sp.]
MKFKITCDTEQGPALGEGEFTLLSDTATRARCRSPPRQGQAFRLDTTPAAG